jgi:glutamine synthetase
MSLWDLAKDVPLMFEADASKAGPYGLSVAGQHFVAGMMKLSRELAVFIAPFINSYKRYASLSWAPVNVVWGRDNRTTGFRLVGRGPALHVEDRFPGGDMNAYLTYAAMMGAGLYGIEHELPLDPEFKGNGYLATGVQRMPRALYEAITELEASDAAVEIFGQDVVDHYLNAAKVEQEVYDSVVHPWERERYLERG